MIKEQRGFSMEKQRRRLGYLLLLPASLVILIVSVYPLIYGIYLSFRNQNFLKPGQNDFVGLMQYFKLFTDKNFAGALGYTLYYTLGIVVLAYILGMCLALMLNKELPLRGAMRALVLIPWIIPSTVAAVNWRWILDSQVGAVNSLLLSMGVIDKSISFLSDPDFVKNTMIAIGVWKSFPFMTLTLMSSLQGISDDIYEAARIDGANARQTFVSITLPLLKPVSFVALTLMSIWTFNNFENIFLLTEGGPLKYTTTISIFTYKTAFFANDISYACSAGTCMMFIMAIFGMIYLKVFLNEENANQTRKKVSA